MVCPGVIWIKHVDLTNILTCPKEKACKVSAGDYRDQFLSSNSRQIVSCDSASACCRFKTDMTKGARKRESI